MATVAECLSSDFCSKQINWSARAIVPMRVTFRLWEAQLQQKQFWSMVGAALFNGVGRGSDSGGLR